MSGTPQLHPTPDQLRAFAQGRLSSGEMSDLERHIATCDSCCHQLEAVPPDTLQQLARDAATAGFRAASAKKPDKTPAPEIPAELQNHARYRVLGLVGTGGMGAVYKAEHRHMERLVALKVISPALLTNPAAVERFHREFRAAAKLSHPNIVISYDAEHEGNLHFLVMEFVEGLSLDRLVDQRGPLPVTQACHLIRQAALGLAHVHEQGMVHRDIKPQNLMVTRKGQLKILDCGLARLSRERVAEQVGGGNTRAMRPDETAAGMILGTPDYIAPEQVTDSRTADIRSDLYSLGCTLYFLLTGQPPFPKGTLLEKLASHANLSPESVLARRSDVPPQLVQILDRLMAKDPAERFQTPAELAKALVPLASDKPGSTQPKPESVPAPVAAPTPSPPPAATVVVPANEPAPLAADPLADLALAGAIGILPPIATARPGSSNPFASPQTIAIVLGCGAALALIILATSFASNWFQPDRPAARQIASVPKKIVPPVVTPPKPPQANLVPSDVGAKRPQGTGAKEFVPPNFSGLGADAHKILFVIPHTGLYGPDYFNVIEALKAAEMKVHVASTALGPVSLKFDHQPPQPIHANIRLTSYVRAANYDAIIFTGYETDDFTLGGVAVDEVERLLREFTAQGKPVTAICRGQRVLAAHGLLEGKTVAACKYAVDAYPSSAVKRLSGVERDGLIITASADKDAGEFIQKIASTLDELRK